MEKIVVVVGEMGRSWMEEFVRKERMDSIAGWSRREGWIRLELLDC